MAIFMIVLKALYKAARETAKLKVLFFMTAKSLAGKNVKNQNRHIFWLNGQPDSRWYASVMSTRFYRIIIARISI
jgi:hypothetical protein